MPIWFKKFHYSRLWVLKVSYFGVTFLFFDIDDTARIITTAAPIRRNIGAYENLF